MSDEPGTYEEDQLKELLIRYLSQDLVTARRIRDILLPTCLEKDLVTREELKQEFVKRDVAADSSKAGYALTVISVQLGMQKNDFLRQVIGYEHPTYYWEKDNYFIRPSYKPLVAEVLSAFDSKRTESSQQSQP